jgi:hypothetical protein
MNLSDRIEEVDTPRGHLAFIKSQWRDFAAFAFERFMSQGRGAIVLDLKNAGRTGDKLRVPAHYVADQSESLRKLGGWPSDEIEEVVQTYNPEQDVVFLILRLDGDVFHYNVSDEPAPPEAWSSKAHRESSS